MFKFFSPAMCFLVQRAQLFRRDRLPPPAADTVHTQAGTTEPVSGLLEGFRTIHSSAALRSLMLLAVVTAFCGVPIALLLPVFAPTSSVWTRGLRLDGSRAGSRGRGRALNVARLGNAPKKGRDSLIMQVFLA